LPIRESEQVGPVNKTNIERITNELFACTMTLLIRVPAVPSVAGESAEALVATISQYLLALSGYLFVFLVLVVT
jgi:hypothetical protein